MKPPTFPTPHRRRNPLTGTWVLVSAQRTDRPWRGEVQQRDVPPVPRHDPACHLCPGATRATGERNPDYTGTYVFTNDFPALVPDVAPESVAAGPLFRAEVEAGTCRVVCFSPRHDLALAEMDDDAVEAVIATWVEEARTLGATYPSVQIFENRGEAMGASNPHPHGQIWAGSSIPSFIEAEDTHQRAYFQEHGRKLLEDYADAETADGARLVVADDEWMAVVPYWAVWPFETILIPRRPVARLTELDAAGRSSLARVLRRLLVRYDNLFHHPFPYSMGWHGAPFGREDAAPWVLHAHFYPPLLRSATIRKFMVGFELTAEAQRDLTPEEAARRLRALPERHYRAAAHAGR
jgi:UDPglucose--hexose-1-phosphate uridylyltransferase